MTASIWPQPLLVVHDVARSSRFYCDVVGLESGHGGDEYEMLFHDGELVMQLHDFSADHHHGPMADPSALLGNGVLMWFEVRDFDDAVRRARAAAAPVVRDVHTNPNAQQQELWIRDPDGYVVVLAGPSPYRPRETPAESGAPRASEGRLRLPDSWTFRQKPTGAFRRVLRIPIHLYHWKLGFLFGDRFLLLTHRGRTSGRAFETPVEVVEHDATAHEYVVCSGTGPHADWYRNLQEAPALAIQVGNRRWVPTQRFLTDEDAAACFARYEAEHPRTAKRLLEIMGNAYDGTDAGRVAMMADMPMVAFSDTGPAYAPDA